MVKFLQSLLFSCFLMKVASDEQNHITNIETNGSHIIGQEFSPVRIEFPSKLNFQPTVSHILPKINIPRMRTFLTRFTEFHNRFFESVHGANSSNWLLSQIFSIIFENGSPAWVNASLFNHSWPQPSVFAWIEGLDLNSNKEIVILGAHLDSINNADPTITGWAPGADDDGSGTVVLLETFRLLLESRFRPKRTLEFHWYSAEEVGLLGSEEISANYFNQKINIVSMVQFDSVGYYSGQSKIGIISDPDHTCTQLNQFLRVIIDSYCKFSWANKLCGHGCSDHASFSKYGYTVGFLHEIETTPFYHSNGDVLSTINFEQVVEFVKVAIGYAIEVSSFDKPALSISSAKKVFKFNYGFLMVLSLLLLINQNGL